MPPTILTIGNFDGVHVGHRQILRRAVALAEARSASVIAMTFDPPPMSVLRPGTEPLRVMGIDEKLAALRAAGAEETVVLKPTPQLLGHSAEDFVREVVEQYHPMAFVEGVDFRFGKNRAGDVELLKSLGNQYQFETHVIDKVEVTLLDQLLAPVSSSLIRWLLAQGRVADAARCLAQPYALTAPVVTGEKRGRTIDVSTANLDPAALKGRMIPGDGVYSGVAVLADGSTHPAAISIGIKPTFNHHDRVIEAHLLNFRGDLYGQTITLQFHRWLRDQQPFPGLDALKSQLTRDIANVQRWPALV